MAGRGRGAKLPSEVKAEKGTIRKCREAPKPTIPAKKIKTSAEPPKHFKNKGFEMALEFWLYYEPMAREIKVLATTDLTALARLCETEMRYRLLLDEFMAQYGGQSTMLDRNGEPKLNPVVKTLNETNAQLYRLYDCFGFTPASRSKVEPVKPLQGEKESPISKLLAMRDKELAV